MRRIKLARTLQQLTGLFPGKYPLHSKVGTRNEPFFVFGSGRNGSTMLNRILNQHPAFFLPSEQYFLGNSIIKFRLYNFLIWRDLVKIIAGELLPATGSHTWSYGPDAVIKDLFHTSDKSLQYVVDRIFRSYGESREVQFARWGDTTPMNTRYMPEITDLFPKAKYIFLLRDGRDVVASYQKGGKDYLGELAAPMSAARHWLRSVAMYEQMLKKTDILLVRYEKLVQDPEFELTRLCQTLDVEYDPGLLDFHLSTPQEALYQEPQHANIRRPISGSSVGNWQRTLAKEDLDMIMPLLQDTLAKYGYV
ncbi:sulfotransferase family protein [Marinoscillum furvescens]|uniref:Sulfotransferase family protein n=1 Tax=Marinoscillum furvescens DSM 4134 TaxID=1122208 RepID=A0A3D9L539_MARFU|nr:sulfotransferase [Marinoscillum furvescens]REE01029.1 sulfotransferase family protein [Marinoscillum furvescens DSM 4134]